MCWSLRSQDSSCQFRKVGMEVTFKEIKITYREAGRKTAVNIQMNSNSDHYGHQGCHISICFWTPAPDMFSSVTQSCPTLCNPKDCSTPGLPVHHQLPEFTQTHVHQVSGAINHLILCHPLLLPPSIFPSISVFSNESVVHIRWPKYWSFSFSISPSNEYSGLISFRMDWLDLLAI